MQRLNRASAVTRVDSVQAGPGSIPYNERRGDGGMIDAAEVKVGTPVIVVGPSYGRRSPVVPIPATVTSAARVWLTITEDETNPPNALRSRTWRMRRDRQDEGNTQYGTGSASFYTLDQWEHRLRVAWANDLLGKQGIRIDRDSSWYDDAGRIKLAEILDAALPDTTN
jgi:hypothetical protein